MACLSDIVVLCVLQLRRNFGSQYANVVLGVPVTATKSMDLAMACRKCASASPRKRRWHPLCFSFYVVQWHFDTQLARRRPKWGLASPTFAVCVCVRRHMLAICMYFYRKVLHKKMVCHSSHVVTSLKTFFGKTYLIININTRQRYSHHQGAHHSLGATTMNCDGRREWMWTWRLHDGIIFFAKK